MIGGLATRVARQGVALEERPNRLAAAAVRRLRRTLERAGDPVVTVEFEGRRMALPLSHDLPYIRARHEHYASNLGRVAAAVAAHRPDATIVDVGANVGDSVLIVRRRTDAPILCIDGDERFLPLLARNVEGLADVEIEPAFLATETGTMTATVTEVGGTARLDLSGTSTIRVLSLEDALARHPRFARPALLKVDIDGLDCAVLRAAPDVLTSARPAVFVEYDPHLQAVAGVDGLAFLRWMRELGWDGLVVWDNVGDYVMTTSLRDDDAVADLHAYMTGRGAVRYWDLCLVHAQDGALVEAIRAGER